MCTRMGKATAATVVDHVVPHRNDKNIFYLGKLQSLCKFHHDSAKKSEEELGFSTEIDVRTGWPMDKRHPVYRRNIRTGRDLLDDQDYDEEPQPPERDEECFIVDVDETDMIA